MHEELARFFNITTHMTVFNVCRNIRCHRHCNVAINTHDNGTADINIELINDSPSVQTCVASDEAQIGMRHYLDVDYGVKWGGQ